MWAPRSKKNQTFIIDVKVTLYKSKNNDGSGMDFKGQTPRKKKVCPHRQKSIPDSNPSIQPNRPRNRRRQVYVPFFLLSHTRLHALNMRVPWTQSWLSGWGGVCG